MKSGETASAATPLPTAAGGMAAAVDPRVLEAVERWRRGEFDDAEAILHDVSSAVAEQHGALHLFGLIALRRQNHQRAIELLRQSSR